MKKDTQVYIFGLKQSGLPGGDYAIITASVPESDLGCYKEENGSIKRKYWTCTRLFKYKKNAIKYYAKQIEEYRNARLVGKLIKAGLFSLN